MTGDQADQFSRLKRQLPPWFGNGPTQLLDSLMQGVAWALAQIYALYAYAKLQTRISTATDGFLDLIGLDFFGTMLQRESGERDNAYRARILAQVFPERGTRGAVIKTLTLVTGRAPQIIEPQQPGDSGSYGGPAYLNTPTANFGSTSNPYAAFVVAYRPLDGSSQYGVSDAAIYAAVNAVKPIGYRIWLAIID